jgi:hypothetical protein
MKNHLLRILAPLAALTLVNCVTAQIIGGKIVDRRDQAEGWYLPVHGNVLASGEKAKDVTIRLYKDNELVGDLPVAKDGSFIAELDIDHTFTLLIMKEGFQNEMLTVDTTLPEGLVQYPAYDCTINMDPTSTYADKEEGFYLDFPAAIVSYNPEMGGFYHSEHYLDHIKSKLSGYAQASF